MKITEIFTPVTLSVVGRTLRATVSVLFCSVRSRGHKKKMATTIAALFCTREQNPVSQFAANDSILRERMVGDALRADTTSVHTESRISRDLFGDDLGRDSLAVEQNDVVVALTDPRVSMWTAAPFQYISCVAHMMNAMRMPIRSFRASDQRLIVLPGVWPRFLYTLFTLVMDHGDTDRLDRLQFIPLWMITVAALVFRRACASLTRALAAHGGKDTAATLEVLDTLVPAAAGEGAVFHAFNAGSRFHVHLRRCAAWALASSVISEVGVWANVVPECENCSRWVWEAFNAMPVPVYSALSDFSKCGRSGPFPIDLVDDRPLMHSATFAEPMTRIIGMSFALFRSPMCRNTTAAAPFEALVAVSERLRFDQAMAHAYDNANIFAGTIGPLMQAAATFDSFSAIVGSRGEWCGGAAVMKTLNELRNRWWVLFSWSPPLETLLSCMPETTEYVDRRSLCELGVEQSLISGATVFDSAGKYLPLNEDARALLDSARAFSAPTACVRFRAGENNVQKFAAYVCIVRRAMLIRARHVAWTAPENLRLTRDSLYMTPGAARAYVINTLMAKLYEHPARLILHYPATYLFVLRECLTLKEIGDTPTRSEVAGSLCDFIRASLTLHVPEKRYDSQRVLDRDEHLVLSVPPNITSTAEAVIRGFVCLLYGHALPRCFPRIQDIGEADIGLCTALAYMLTTPDPTLPVPRWPRAVLRAAYRQVWLAYARCHGYVSDRVFAFKHDFFEKNEAITQACAWLYIHTAVTPSSVARLLANARAEGGVDPNNPHTESMDVADAAASSSSSSSSSAADAPHLRVYFSRGALVGDNTIEQRFHTIDPYSPEEQERRFEAATNPRLTLAEREYCEPLPSTGHHQVRRIQQVAIQTVLTNRASVDLEHALRDSVDASPKEKARLEQWEKRNPTLTSRKRRTQVDLMSALRANSNGDDDDDDGGSFSGSRSDGMYDDDADNDATNGQSQKDLARAKQAALVAERNKKRAIAGHQIARFLLFAVAQFSVLKIEESPFSPQLMRLLLTTMSVGVPTARREFSMHRARLNAPNTKNNEVIAALVNVRSGCQITELDGMYKRSLFKPDHLMSCVHSALFFDLAPYLHVATRETFLPKILEALPSKDHLHKALSCDVPVMSTVLAHTAEHALMMPYNTVWVHNFGGPSEFTEALFHLRMLPALRNLQPGMANLHVNHALAMSTAEARAEREARRVAATTRK